MGFSRVQHIPPSTLKTPLIGGVFFVIEKKKLLLRILTMLKFDQFPAESWDISNHTSPNLIPTARRGFIYFEGF